MLVLTRRKGESIIIGDQIEIVVLGQEGEQVKIGIRAPQSIPVFRQELYSVIQQSNREAMQSSFNMQKFPNITWKTEGGSDK
ncbi:Translational regulator CsrA [Paenibacillus solanacearum]|uniref:Translational regulator CsrA n=1 Tax=Paenibacillus solanacearum TaxID=2048548 RepID=A0A916K2Z1_9BACL|nr:carbon storage regulator CsrA [Paenibacillus solanacearum]CAG7633960.1 Translational regulator CsrA [Paenibacillus solanacearum]